MGYRIRAEVWGGVTGPRSSYLKFAGNEYRTDSKEEAERYAAQLTQDRMSDPHRTASFQYTAEPW